MNLERRICLKRKKDLFEEVIQKVKQILPLSLDHVRHDNILRRRVFAGNSLTFSTVGFQEVQEIILIALKSSADIKLYL